ncbi:MAG: PEGA domain-containing protein [Candidatus Hydrogenedentes bacterium]|nr:PEGA domain-containing protein [Candidatus Hydrogenedentota bacterium]
MKICPGCKIAYQPESNFCRQCGARLVDEKASTPHAMARRETLERRIAQEPRNTVLLLEYVDFLLSISDRDEAISQLRGTIDLNPDESVIRRKLAGVYAAGGDWDHAATHWLLLVESEPGNLDALEQLITVLLQGKREAEAADALARLTRLQPGNAEVLWQRLALLDKLGRRDEAEQIIRNLLDIPCDDVAQWLRLGRRCSQEHLSQEQERACAAALRLAPENGAANLHCGIARYHAALQHGDGPWAGIAQCFERALADKEAIDADENVLARLYLNAARIRAGAPPATRWPDLERLLDANTKLAGRHALVAAWCYETVAEAQRAGGDIDTALRCYAAALPHSPSGNLRERTASAFLEKASPLLAKRRFRLAKAVLRDGLVLVPEHAGLLKALQEALRRERGRWLRASAAAIAVAACAGAVLAFLHYGQAMLDIRVAVPLETVPGATTLSSALERLKTETLKVTVTRGDRQVAESVSAHLQTPLLRFGRYRIRVEKEGFHAMDQTVWVTFGRGVDAYTFEMTPIYASLRVDSDPAGAAVTVRNPFQVRTGATPCLVEQLIAIPATIEVTAEGCTPFTAEASPAPDQILDLGTISFKGGLKIDSEPPGAEVLIDNEPRGVTPLELPGLPAKSALVVVRAENIGIYARRVIIEPGTTTDLGRVSLANLGALHVTSNPEGAKVTVDGKEAGVTPLALNNVDVGERRLRVVADGCVPFEKTVTVASGAVADAGTISFIGAVKLDSSPTDAEVYVDGEQKGRTPLVLEDLPARETRIEVRQKGTVLSYSRLVAVKPGETTDLGVVTLCAPDQARKLVGSWSGTWQDVSGSYRNFDLIIRMTAEDRLTAEGKAQGWSVTELFEGTIEDATLVLVGKSVTPVQPGKNHALDTLRLEIRGYGNTLSGTWSDEEEDSGRVELKRGAAAPRTAVLTGDKVNVRTGPSTSHDVMTQLRLGATVHILSGPNDNWYNVRTADGTVGWIRGDYLNIQ